MNFKRISTCVQAIVLAVVIISIIYVFGNANINHYTAHLDSDIASETLLAKVLYDNGHVQPDTWIMSTGKRIFATPMLASFLYDLVGGDLNKAMGISCTIMILGLVAAMLFFGKQIGFSLLQNLVMITLVLSLSKANDSTQQMLFLYASYYVGHFICMFVLLGIYAGVLKKNKVSFLALLITLPMAVLNGMQGIHASMFFYIPLFGTEFIRQIVLLMRKENNNHKSIPIWVFAITAISYLGTKLFGDYLPSETSRNIRHAPEKLINVVIPNFLKVLGYERLTFFVLIFVVLAVIGYVLAASRLAEDERLWSIFPVLLGVITLVLITTFTTAESAPRYYLMQVFVVGIGMAALMNLVRSNMVGWLSIIVAVYGIVSAYTFNDELVKDDSSGNSEYMQIANWMSSENCDYGYSNFDHANSMTVTCNEKVMIRAVNSFGEMEGSKWLSDKTWYPPFKDSSEPVCYVVSNARKDEFMEFVSLKNPIIIDQREIGSFTIYVTDHDYTVWVD